MSKSIFDSTQTAEYYDSTNIRAFYEQCWGGEDIHIGLYATGTETVAEASAAMTRHLLDRAGIASGVRVLDIACGFGGTLRTLAKAGCQVRGLDISQACVDRARRGNEAAGLNQQIEVTLGDFHRIDSATARWDVVICQEAIIHSADRRRVFAEVYRVLRPGGTFVFSDILTATGADPELVATAFARLGARAGDTISDYQAMAEDAGFEMLYIEERLDDIRTHYDKLAELLAAPIAGLDRPARAKIAESIRHWQTALAAGAITWACFVARKPAEEGQ